ncbi:EAL domain-containing protein [Thiomicrospira sp. S5]|uniref:EAL domain-containing protein n=1 Tax=Thiomicrospira sp. S5 TaxID=1803865 RepID=UPI000F8F275B|nr:EAL domain-containing protein [Thiomicrospira sp. S5]
MPISQPIARAIARLSHRIQSRTRMASQTLMFTALSLIYLTSHAQQTLTLGVYAYLTPEKVHQQYQPLADYLSQQLGHTNIQLAVLNHRDLRQALRQEKLDLLLVNPSLYEIVRNENRLSGAIATLQTNYSGQPTAQLGGVIFTLANRQDIQGITDLSKKTVAIPSFSNAGAYRIPIYETRQHGISAQEMKFLRVGQNDKVVEAVLNGQADAGFVRTGILENMIDQGLLSPNQITVLNARQFDHFPFMVSTPLYPEWPFVALTHVDDAMVRKLSVALFSLTPDSPTSQAARIAGFVPPLDYLPVENLLRELHLEPYDKPPELTWNMVWKNYAFEILAAFILFLALIAAFLRISLLSQRIATAANRIQAQSTKLSNVLHATHSVTWEWDVPSDKVHFNTDMWSKIMGYDVQAYEEFTFENRQELTHPDDQKALQSALRNHFSGETDFYQVETRMRHQNGSWVWILSQGKVIEWGADQRPLKVSGTHTDITQIKQQEALLDFKSQRDQILLKLPANVDNLSKKSLIRYALNLTEELTESRLGFVRILDEFTPDQPLSFWSSAAYERFSSEQLAQIKLTERTFCQTVMQNRKSMILNDVTLEDADFSDGFTPKKLLIIPVVANQQVVMILGLADKPTAYSDMDQEAAELIAYELWRMIQRKRDQQQIESQQEQYERLVDEIGRDYCVFSLEPDTGRITYISDSAKDIFGQPKNALLKTNILAGIHWQDDSQQNLKKALDKLVSQHENENTLDLTFNTPQGDKRAIKVMQHTVLDDQSRLTSIDGLIENITDKIQTEHDLIQAANVFRHSQEAILITDRQGHILNINDAFTRITGYSKEEVLGETPRVLSSGKHDKTFYAELWRELFDQGTWSGEIWNRRKNGEIYPEKMTVSSILDENGSPKEFIALFSDITTQKKQQSQLEYIAHFDALTGLPNRTLLADRLNQAITYSKRHQLNLAVLFIDLDGFKAINDLYGHQAGDELLITIAKRFKKALREEDTIARIGGDEFVAVILDIEDTSETDALLQRLLEDANKSMTFEDNLLKVSASIGVSFYNQQNDLDADQIIRQADQAMYQAKMKGKNQVYVFDEKTLGSMAQTQELMALEQGVKNDELRLYFQPKIHLREGHVLGFESLIRWQHPEKGLLSPAAFLPLLRDHPLSIDVGFWVIEAAMKQMQQWKTLGLDINLSINLEGELLQEPDFIPRLGDVLNRYPDIPARNLTLEILETSALEDIFSVSKTMTECSSKLGVNFSIDDFGTGYASLTYLKHLPVTELKVDQSFVKDLHTEPQSLSIMESIIGMGDAFNLDVIAEGVETDEQATLLLKLGCNMAQGYHISRPMPPAEIPGWMAQWQPAPHWHQVEKLDKRDLSLIAAATEHRSWINTLHKFVHDQVDAPPPLELSRCGFGQWLNAKGPEMIQDTERLEAIHLVHSQVHYLGELIIELKRHGKQEDAIAELHHLNSMKNELLAHIDALADQL